MHAIEYIQVEINKERLNILEARITLEAILEDKNIDLFTKSQRNRLYQNKIDRAEDRIQYLKSEIDRIEEIEIPCPVF
jgi:hypothetical protein